ncbi:MAG: hypothetical protein ACM3PV_15215 [Betaproteobacteria bacterium]
MKASSLVVVALLAVSLAACQRQAAPERAAAASPAPASQVAEAPSPAAPAAQPAEAAAGGRVDPATGVRIESEPAARTARRPPASRPAPAPVDTQAAAPQRQAAAAPAPAAAARPAAEPIVLAAGTVLPIRLGETLASDKSQPEQKVLAELAADVRAGDRVVLPAGSEVVGHVVIAQQSGRVKGRARLVVGFDEVRAHGKSYAIEAARWDVTAESSKGRDAKIAGGAAAAGAIIGAIAGGGKGALKGGLIGGAAGGAAVLVTRGNEVELRSGVTHKITLRQALRIE